MSFEAFKKNYKTTRQLRIVAHTPSIRTNTCQSSSLEIPDSWMYLTIEALSRRQSALDVTPEMWFLMLWMPFLYMRCYFDTGYAELAIPSVVSKTTAVLGASLVPSRNYLVGFITSVTTGLAGNGVPSNAATIKLAESSWYVVPALL